jgi:copper transport outer membrane protein MctB
LIDFRYHLVSIVAVFLALAIGLVIGSTALRGYVVTGLNAVSQHEQKVNKSLYAHNTQLRARIGADDAFARAAEARLLGGLLTGERVVLVLAPGTDSSTVTGISSALSQAGATVTGKVVLSAQFFDTGTVTEQQLRSTVTSLEPLGVALPKSPSDPQIAGQQAAAQVIAAAIVNKDGLQTLTRAQSQQILTEFGDSGFLQITGAGGAASLAGQATMAVVVVPGTVPPAATSWPFNLALVSLAGDLQEASKGAVLAGNLKGSGQHSAISAVNSGAAGVKLTTIDNADTAPGQVIVAQALRELLLPNATPRAYGVRPARVPSPAPSPSPSTSASPSSSRSPRPHPSSKKSAR